MDVIADGLRAALGPTAAIYAMAALGLNMHFGYTGLLNFGQVGFMLVGAYGVAVSVAIWQWPLWLALLFALGLTLVLSLLLGVPTLRLRADYLAITTIAAGEILRLVTNSRPATDVTAGVFGIPSQISEGRGFTDTFNSLNPFGDFALNLGIVSFQGRDTWVMFVAWSLVLLASAFLWALMRSPWGLVIKSIREDEDAARALGKNVFAYKMQSLMIGGAMGGLAGVLLVLQQASVSPGVFLPQVTFFAYVVLILGGTASTWGPVVGSIIFWFLIAGSDSVLRGMESLPSGSAGAIRLALVGLTLMLLMIFRPQGILGDKQEMMLDA